MDFRADQFRPPPGYRPPAAPANPRRIVRCGACGRIEYVSADDLAGYLQSGWPRCCAGVMTYFLEDELVGTDGPERPAG